MRRLVALMIKYVTDSRTGVLITTLLFFILLYPLTKPFPYSDDWSYVYYLATPNSLNISWLFELHNDHRIPLQKILHIGLLHLTGGDFRILIAANVMVISATSLCWITYSRFILNEKSWSEWLVPALLLSFGFNTVAWSFSFQFLSALFFLAWANLLWARSVLSGQKNLGGSAYLALTLCAFCGGNGLITSTIVGSGFLCAIVFGKGVRWLSSSARACLVTWVAAILVIWLGWTSSSATEVKTNDTQQYFHFALQMLKSWLGLFAMNSSFFKTLFASFVLAVALGGGFLLILRAKLHNYSPLIVLPVFLSALQTFLTIIAISYARAGVQPWWPGLELHYGYLATALPLSAWVVILFLPKGLMRNLLLGIFFVVIGVAYLINADWRIRAAQNEYLRGTSASKDIVSSMSAEDVANRHLKEFYWLEGKQAEIAVSNGLIYLRQTRFWFPRIVK